MTHAHMVAGFDANRYMYVVPYTYGRMTRHGVAWVQQGFVNDGASGDPSIRGHRLNLIRDLEPECFSGHDHDYMLGGFLVRGECGLLELVPASKLYIDWMYAWGLFRRHRYGAATLRFLALRTPMSRKCWKDARKRDCIPWQQRVAERTIPHPELWEYTEGWHLRGLRAKA